MKQERIKATALKPAYAYVRVSSAEQAKRGGGLDRQHRLAEEFIEQRGWTFAGLLADEGRSAFHGVNRNEGAALFEFEMKARAGHFATGAVLVVENVDRLSRENPKKAAQLVWSLNEAGVDVATFHDGHIYKAGDGDMMEIFGLIIKASVAHEESFKKSERAKANWQKRYASIEEGTTKAVSGRLPAWLMVDDSGEIQTHPQRANVVREIFTWYCDGLSLYLIQQNLNKRAEPTFSGNIAARGWSKSAITHILSNRSVLGEFYAQSGKHIPVRHYPQIISLEQFNRAAELRQLNSRTGGSSKWRGNNLFTGIAKCGQCGGTMGFLKTGGKSTYTNKAGVKTIYNNAVKPYLVCDSARRGYKCTNKVHLRYDYAEAAILKQLLWAAVEDDDSNPSANAVRVKISETLHQIELRSRQVNNLIDSMSQVASRTLAERVTTLETEIENLQTKLDNLNENLEMQLTKPTTYDDMEAIKLLSEAINHSDPDIRETARVRTNAALKRVIEMMTINPDGTFLVLAPIAVWEFDRNGKRIGGQAL